MLYEALAKKLRKMIVYTCLIPRKIKKNSTADANDILWHYFHRTLFYQVFRDFLAWYLSSAYAVFSSKMSRKIVNFCSQYRQNFLNTMI